MNEQELLTEYAKSWNNLDISYIENHLHEDMEYTSQWVLETMYGKDRYLKYLEAKFNTIRNGINIPTAELGFFKVSYKRINQPCLVLTQGDFKASLIVEIKDKKLYRIDMVGVPAPESAVLLGIVPR